MDLDPYDTESLQAAPTAYTNHHTIWVTRTDAVHTVHGGRPQPASDSAADRLTD